MIFKIYSSIAYFISRNILKSILIIFFGVKVRGVENIPAKGAFIIASNHASYMDPPIVGMISRRRIYFVTSDHLYKNMLMALWYNTVDCIKIKRGQPDHGAIRKILKYLKEGKPVAMFPEGTRSEDGKLREPLSGIGFLALKSQVPVVPCLVKGTEKALPKGAKFFKPSKITIYIGEPIEAKDFKYEGDEKEGYRLFSKKVMNRIVQLGRKYGY